VKQRPVAAVFLAAGVLLWPLAAGLATANANAKMTKTEVEERLTCQCGCGLTVATCNHLQCSFAVPARKDIEESLARGETGEHIIARYVEKYGEKILSSPTTRGFNLLAWIGPYFAVFAAGLFVVIKVRRSVANPSDPGDRAHVKPLSERDHERIQRELKDL